MPTDCFIGVDQGSSATKAVAISTDGRILYQTRKELPPPFRDNVRIEHDGEDIIRSVIDTLNESIRAVGFNASILGLGLSCQRSSCLAWNASDGAPLTPVISWRDERGLELIESIRDRESLVRRKSGLPLTPYYSASKLRWIRDNIAAERQPDALFGPLSSFIVRRLIGHGPDELDHTNAARTQLMNINTLAWDDELLGLFGLTGLRFPMIVPSGHAFGKVQSQAGDIPLLACIGDQQAAMLGLGVIGQGDAGINFGTGAFLMVNTGSGLVPAQNLMASVHYSTENERHYLLEGSVNAAGEALEWLRANLGLFREYGEVDDLCWRAATDTVAFIGLNGTGAPHWETNISSSFHGLGQESTSADMVRAVVEGFAFFIADIAEAVREYGIEPRNFVLAGGLSSLTYLSQIQADILKTSVRVSTGGLASALGAAFLAGMQHGAWKSDDIRRMTSQNEIVSGEANPGLERRYKKWKHLHRTTRELDRM